MYRRILISMMAISLATTKVCGQVFSHDAWEQKNLLSLKMSQLYYELNVGVNINPHKRSADFIYFGFGYGKPTKKNAWRKFLPEKEIPETLSKSQQEIFMNSGADDLYAGKIGIGWNHWFNHVFGLYAQTGWGFIADLSTGNDLPEDIVEKLDTDKDKSTFIYNTIPIELGLSLNLWQHYHIQAGVTYMWKEIPLLTVGIGYAF